MCTYVSLSYNYSIDKQTGTQNEIRNQDPISTVSCRLHEEHDA